MKEVLFATAAATVFVAVSAAFAVSLPKEPPQDFVYAPGVQVIGLGLA